MNLFALILQVTLLAVATASYVRYVPTKHSVTYETIGPYTYKIYYSHHKKYLYTYETCSSPPSSIEVCLSTLITSIQGGLEIIDKNLAINAASIKAGFAYEVAGLKTEISLVEKVKEIASSVTEKINMECTSLELEIEQIQDEKANILKIYENVEAELSYLLIDIENVNEERVNLYKVIVSVEHAKWDLEVYLSKIVEEKRRIVVQEEAISQVVSQLYEEAKKIESKISQLNKRQIWLSVWESKLYVGIENFQQQIELFQSKQKVLYSQNLVLSANQKQLYIKVQNAKQAIQALKEEYYSLNYNLQALYYYHLEICSMSTEVSNDASYFIEAYQEFTCEETLLSYEACSKSALAASAPAPAPAVTRMA